MGAPQLPWGSKQIMVKILPILAVAVACLATSAGADCGRATVAGSTRQISAHDLDERLLDRAILAEVNYRRCLSGLSALKPQSALRSPARDHSVWMASARQVSHRSTLAGRATLSDRVRSTGLPVRAAAENIAQVPLYNLPPRFRIVDRASCQFASPSGKALGRHSYRSLAAKVVTLWMESPGHRRNLLSRKTTQLASVAIVNPRANYCGDVYVTQIFVG